MSNNNVTRRILSVVFVGYPNAGKSTLLNNLVKIPLAAVSRAAGTTRRRVIGVSRHDLGEQSLVIQWIDAPGFQLGVRWTQRLERSLHQEAIESMSEGDIVALVIDVSLKEEKFWSQINECKDRMRFPNLVILNKVDRVRDRNSILPRMEKLQRVFPQAQLIPLSALRGDGSDRILKVLFSDELIHQSTPITEEEWVEAGASFTLNTSRQISQDWMRGALLEGLFDEVPMGVDVLIEGFREDERDIRIQATVVVERESLKGIVIGAQASRLKEAGIKARALLGQIFDKPVHVNYHVSVRHGWTQKEGMLHELGY